MHTINADTLSDTPTLTAAMLTGERASLIRLALQHAASERLAYRMLHWGLVPQHAGAGAGFLRAPEGITGRETGARGLGRRSATPSYLASRVATVRDGLAILAGRAFHQGPDGRLPAPAPGVCLDTGRTMGFHKGAGLGYRQAGTSGGPLWARWIAKRVQDCARRMDSGD